VAVGGTEVSVASGDGGSVGGEVGGEVAGGEVAGGEVGAGVVTAAGAHAETKIKPASKTIDCFLILSSLGNAV
jgi:hypothetical protein